MNIIIGSTLLGFSTGGGILLVGLIIFFAVVLLYTIRSRARANNETISVIPTPLPGYGFPTPPVFERNNKVQPIENDGDEYDAAKEAFLTIARRPRTPLFMTAIPRNPFTLSVTFALNGDELPDGVEVLVNETERHDFSLQDEYIIEGLEPGVGYGVSVRVYRGEGIEREFSESTEVRYVTMPLRDRDLLDVQPFEPLILDDMVRPDDDAEADDELDLFNRSYMPLPPAISLSERIFTGDEPATVDEQPSENGDVAASPFGVGVNDRDGDFAGGGSGGSWQVTTERTNENNVSVDTAYEPSTVDCDQPSPTSNDSGSSHSHSESSSSDSSSELSSSDSGSSDSGGSSDGGGGGGGE